MACDVPRPIPIVTACLRADGLPTFARTEVEVTPEQVEDGVHYYLAEAELLQQGYEEPMVHFAEFEAPAFLFPAVDQSLVDSVVPNLILTEKA